MESFTNSRYRNVKNRLIAVIIETGLKIIDLSIY